MACQAAGSHEPAIGMAEKPQTFPNREALRYKGTGYANVNPAIAKRIFEVTLCVYYSGVPLGEGTNLLVEGVHMRKNLLMLFASTFALAAVPAFAQNASPKMLASVPQAVAPGCGANNIKFAVKTQRGQQPFPDP